MTGIQNSGKRNLVVGRGDEGTIIDVMPRLFLVLTVTTHHRDDLGKNRTTDSTDTTDKIMKYD